MSTWKKIALWKKILIGVVIGLIIGFVSPAAAEFISPLGDIFLRMLKMLIVPLVFFSITSGICKMGDVKQLRTVGVRYVLWIVVSAVIAATCGVIAGLIVQPGKGTTEFLAAAEAAEALYRQCYRLVPHQYRRVYGERQHAADHHVLYVPRCGAARAGR